MKTLLKLIVVTLTTVFSVSSLNVDFLDKETPYAAVNNGVLMLYEPSPPSPKQQQHLGEADHSSETGAEAESETGAETEPEAVAVMRTFRPSLGGHYVHLYGGGQVRNTTESVTDEQLLHESREPLGFAVQKSDEQGDEPLVLIVHTHTSESFLNVSDDTFRSTDSSRNIVAVGAKIAEEIKAAGFGVIHDTTVHDSPKFSGAYGRSAETVSRILREYPSIKIVLDVHRDAIEYDGIPVAAVSGQPDEASAQIMIISPADNGDWGVPEFMQNFRFAARLQTQLESDNPGLTRAVLFQYCNYNLHLAPGALLVEVGSHGNTLEQALYAGELLGQSLGRLLESLADES
jgi:stage II sporulation protein P